MVTTAKIRKVQRPHWYKFEEYACPVCGNGEGDWERIRVYGKKPKDVRKIYVSHIAYDWCNEYGGLIL